MGVDVCGPQAAALTMGMTMGKRGCGARHRVGCARRARVRFGQRALVGSGHVEQGARSVGGGREVEGGGGVWRCGAALKSDMFINCCPGGSGRARV